MRPEDERYFERIESQLADAFEVAEAARAGGGDPEPTVEIPLAQDMADRVENLLGIPGVADRIRDLESRMSREEAALELARDFAEGRVGEFESMAGKIEGAVRTAVALLTEGVVAAPIEGIDRVELSSNDDGSEFVRVFYAGPIRSAGGTAQALSVLVADYTRSLLGVEEYKPRDDEIERYVEEVGLYDSDTGLQYSPKDEETRFIARHCPIMLDGEATGDVEVSGFRDIDRVDTNKTRGGMCLVLAEGIALKAPKIKRYTSSLEEVDWPWLDDLIDGTIADGSDGNAGTHDGDGADPDPDVDTKDDARSTTDDEASERAGPPRVDPADKYLRDLIAGRPVFAHPSRPGGFRLRYGRARNHGFATAGIHPATMHLLDDFLATGTQIKTERPGKAAGVIPVDSIEGPTVRLANGEVRRIDDADEALEIRTGVDEILDVGEYLVNAGEFIENNHPLAPASYAYEWWIQEFERTDADVQALRDDPHVDLRDPTAEEALEWAERYAAPLHPRYTFLWHDISVEQFEELVRAVDGVSLSDSALVIPRTDPVQTALEALLIEHVQDDETVRIEDPLALIRSMGCSIEGESVVRGWDELSSEARGWPNSIEAVNEVAPFAVRERAPTRIGNRMGRPEKSERRELSPAVHTLFPIGDAGGDQRDVVSASRHSTDMKHTPGEITVELGRRTCVECEETTFRARCPACDGRTEPTFECPECESTLEPDESGRATCGRCEREGTTVDSWTIALDEHLRSALDDVGEREGSFEILKGVKGLTSATKTPEPVEKGILRAKHGVSMFKDGTIRYDMTDLPVTAVTPNELSVTVEHFLDLGYETDLEGDPLTHDDQLVGLKVQDIILSDGAAEHLMQTAGFVDDLLERYYDLEPFYRLEDRDDLVGELVFGMAPHTSAAVVGRIVGFTGASVGYAHPYFHAAKRRNCFHPSTGLRYRRPDGRWCETSIERLVERYLSDPREDDFGTLVQPIDADLRVPSVRPDGTRTERRIEAMAKHPAPDHLVEIETAGGRTLRVTPDHPVLRWDHDALERAPASSIEPGDSLPTVASDPATDRAVARPTATDGGPRRAGTDAVERVRYVPSDVAYTYSITVAETNSFAANGILTANCDGDEDCVMLLMDGLLNFSRAFLPSSRGGSMDAPLVMSSRIDPAEIDDEAHNMDIVDRYPLAFYEATLEMADPDSVDLAIAEATVGTDNEYAPFAHTHDTSNIALGPDLSAYKTLGSMMDKMDAQLALARKLRAVEERDVAERVIEYHFLPDLLGNLRAFSSQETRCHGCGAKYRRVPLSGKCGNCGGDLTLTVHQGSVNKYMDAAIRVADDFGCREYTKQRLQILERSLESIFENDKNKQSGIADFM